MLSIQSCNNISISAPVVETSNNQSTSNTNTPATETTSSNNI